MLLTKILTRRFIYFSFLLVATCLVLTVGISLINFTPIKAQTNNNLLISAAASLKDSLEEVKTLYKINKQSVIINYNFAASGALQQQIENGAPVDVFISAAKKQMDGLRSKGLILTDTERNLLTNNLVLIVPINTSDINTFQQLTNSKVKRIAIGEPRSVPAGQYAQEVFKNLNILPQVKPKFVFLNNVRQVLTAVESGNVDAGVVYSTDAKTSKRVKQVAIAPKNSHSPIVYSVAVIKNSKNIPAAKQYLQFLFKDKAKKVFKKYEFGIA